MGDPTRDLELAAVRKDAKISKTKWRRRSPAQRPHLHRGGNGREIAKQTDERKEQRAN